MKPTPLPWHLEEIYPNVYNICDKHDNIVCELHGSFQYKNDKMIGEQEKADGNFILETINFYNKHKGDINEMDK